MTIDALKAAQAYANTARVAQNAPQTEQAAPTAKPDFAALVENAVASTASSLNAAEKAGQAVAVGEASLVDVVTAVSAAEVSLEAAIAVRNRVIEAYQDILRMPI